MRNADATRVAAVLVLALLAATSAGCGKSNGSDGGTETPGDAGTAKFANPQPVTIQGYQGFADEPFISRDGQYLFWNDPNGHTFYAKKITDTTFDYIGKVQGFDTSAVYNGVPSMDSAGNFYFVSAKSPSTYRIYRGKFTNGMLTNISVLDITGDQHGQDHEISADGQTLYYMVPKDSTNTASTLVVASRNADGSFTKLANSDDLLKNITADNNAEYAPDISSDGLELYYTSIKPEPGVHVARRSSTSEPFGPPQLVIGEDNAAGLREAPSISPDGRRLYYGQQVLTPGVQNFLMQIYVLRR